MVRRLRPPFCTVGGRSHIGAPSIPGRSRHPGNRPILGVPKWLDANAGTGIVRSRTRTPASNLPLSLTRAITRGPTRRWATRTLARGRLEFLPAMPDCPQKKRGLSGGEQGKDVQAVQRAVWAALCDAGVEPTNARNGTYGTQTTIDVQSWQLIAGIEATGKTGQPTLASLWPYFDAYGRSLYFKAKIGQAALLPNGRLVTGNQGDRVRAAQQMMWRGLGDESRNLRNRVYGDGLEADVRHFLGIADLAPGDGNQITQSLWEMMWAFGDDYAHELAGGAPTTGADVRSNLVTWAEWYVATGGQYVQARPYQRDVPPVEPLRNDCSGSIHHLYRLAGGPDPSGCGFDGSGYTGTMQVRGSRLELDDPGLEAGDCVFYGGSYGGESQHVAMLLDQDRLFTFGSNPPTITLFGVYWVDGLRGDIGARRYMA